MWRAGRTSRSRKTDPSPNADIASAEPAASAAGRSAGVATRRMPRPPPPAAALTSNGKPIRSASARIAGTASARSTATGSTVPGHALDADGPGEPARLDLVAERLDHGSRRSDEDEAGVLDGSGERRSLGQEPVSRVDRFGPGLRGRREDRVDPQVALGRRRRPEPDGDVGHPDVLGVGVRVAVDRDRLHPQLVAGTDDPDRDLAAVGDQDPAEGRAGRAHAARPSLRKDGRSRSGLRGGCCHASSAGWCPACRPARPAPG